MKKTSFLSMVLLFAIFLSSCSGAGSSSKETPTPTVETGSQEGQAETDTASAADNTIDSFIEGYNKNSPKPITEVISIDITAKDSGHYRTEFRLNAFSDAVSKSGKIGDKTIDIIAYGKNNQDLRIYSSGLSLEEAKEIVAYASPLLDADLSNDDIDSVLAKIDKDGEANGEYYGKLGITLLGKYKSEGYELMIKKE